MLKFTMKDDKIIIQPATKLGDKIKPISRTLYKCGYKLEKNEEYKWHWW